MRFLITAGPTREAIDPVRFLSNHSSGKMGYAIAEAALAAGHEVTLVSGPVSISPPPHITLVPVVSAAEMYEAVADRIGESDVAIMVAAVADYRPRHVSEEKIKKSEAQFTLELERTEDILGNARAQMGFRGVLVGFAAETENLEAHALKKLCQKKCDLLVANDVSSPGVGFGSEENAVTIFSEEGSVQRIGPCLKTEIASELVSICESLT